MLQSTFGVIHPSAVCALLYARSTAVPVGVGVAWCSDEVDDMESTAGMDLSQPVRLN